MHAGVRMEGTATSRCATVRMACQCSVHCHKQSVLALRGIAHLGYVGAVWLVQNLSRGCRVYFPVFVEGANLSMGDMHFSQGDGEVSFCGAIEMSGFLELRSGPST